MTDGPDNLVLRQLRSTDIKVDRILHEVQALKLHTVAIESGLAALRKDISNLDERMARIETRVELREEA